MDSEKQLEKYWTEERLKDLCMDMHEFADKHNTYIFTQYYLRDFPRTHAINKKLLDKLINRFLAVEMTYFHVKCKLANKIIKNHMEAEKNLKMHPSLAIKYLKCCDEHLRESELNERVEANMALSVGAYFSESYADAELDPKYKKIHTKNLEKLRNYSAKEANKQNAIKA